MKWNKLFEKQSKIKIIWHSFKTKTKIDTTFFFEGKIETACNLVNETYLT